MKNLALITGGTSGIGAGIARELVPNFDLALGYEKDGERAEAEKKNLQKMRPDARIEIYANRLSGNESAKLLFEKVEADFGRPPTCLVHSAGRIRDGLFVDSDFQIHEELLEEHLLSGMSLARLCLPSMYREKSGRILFLSSISAHFFRRGQSSYAAAKLGIEGFAKTLALEVAHRGITVNCVAPGLIATEMTADILERLRTDPKALREKVPAGFSGEPKDVGALVRFLVSEEARYITGAVIPVDGGQSLGDSRS